MRLQAALSRLGLPSREEYTDSYAAYLALSAQLETVEHAILRLARGRAALAIGDYSQAREDGHAVASRSPRKAEAFRLWALADVALAAQQMGHLPLGPGQPAIAPIDVDDLMDEAHHASRRGRSTGGEQVDHQALQDALDALVEARSMVASVRTA